MGFKILQTLINFFRTYLKVISPSARNQQWYGERDSIQIKSRTNQTWPTSQIRWSPNLSISSFHRRHFTTIYIHSR